MSEFDRIPREYRSPPLSDLQQALPERKVWTRDTPVAPVQKGQFWSGFSVGAAVLGLLSGFVVALFYALVSVPCGPC